MRRRVLLATVSSVVLAVLLLGVPLAIAGALIVRQMALGSAQDRAESLGRNIDRRLQLDEPVTTDVIEPFVNADAEWTAHVVVSLPDGTVREVGPVADEAYVASTTTPSGVSVSVEVPQSAVLAAILQVVLLVAVVAAIAIAGGFALGLFQARRLSEPLVTLAASAERLGRGQIRAATPPSGMEEVDLVAREIADSAERMASRLASEREFASDASHQLRTPLTALSMRLEEITLATDDPAVHEEARIALDQVERLVQVVDDLLVRTRHGPSVPTVAVYLADVLAQQQEEWRPAFTAMGRVLEVDLPDGIVVHATPGPLGQTVATLLENSLQHGGGTTRVRTRTTGTSVVLEVSDEGEGVPESLGARVFERTVSSAASTGLGLSLARDLVTADGGRLELLRHRPPVFAVFLRGA